MFKLPMISVVGDLIGNILENKAVLIAIVTFAATVLIRCGIKIYNMGRLSKADLITRQEFKELEAGIRADMKAYRDEIFNSVWELCKTYLNTELKDIKDVKRISEEMKVNSAVFEAQVKLATERYNELKPLAQNVQILENKVRRIEYGNDSLGQQNGRTDD